MTTTLVATSTIPTPECPGGSPSTSVRTASTVTYAASAKNEPAITRRATFSRRSGSGPANCQATAAAELTSITESSPNPISATDDAIVPAVIATTASTTL
jgi:hypothetical protein